MRGVDEYKTVSKNLRFNGSQATTLAKESCFVRLCYVFHHLWPDPKQAAGPAGDCMHGAISQSRGLGRPAALITHRTASRPMPNPTILSHSASMAGRGMLAGYLRKDLEYLHPKWTICIFRTLTYVSKQRNSRSTCRSTPLQIITGTVPMAWSSEVIVNTARVRI